MKNLSLIFSFIICIMMTSTGSRAEEFNPDGYCGRPSFSLSGLALLQHNWYHSQRDSTLNYMSWDGTGDVRGSGVIAGAFIPFTQHYTISTGYNYSNQRGHPQHSFSIGGKWYTGSVQNLSDLANPDGRVKSFVVWPVVGGNYAPQQNWQDLSKRTYGLLARLELSYILTKHLTAGCSYLFSSLGHSSTNLGQFGIRIHLNNFAPAGTDFNPDGQPGAVCLTPIVGYLSVVPNTDSYYGDPRLSGYVAALGATVSITTCLSASLAYQYGMLSQVNPRLYVVNDLRKSRQESITASVNVHFNGRPTQEDTMLSVDGDGISNQSLVEVNPDGRVGHVSFDLSTSWIQKVDSYKYYSYEITGGVIRDGEDTFDIRGGALSMKMPVSKYVTILMGYEYYDYHRMQILLNYDSEHSITYRAYEKCLFFGVNYFSKAAVMGAEIINPDGVLHSFVFTPTLGMVTMVNALWDDKKYEISIIQPGWKQTFIATKHLTICPSVRARYTIGQSTWNSTESWKEYEISLGLNYHINNRIQSMGSFNPDGSPGMITISPNIGRMFITKNNKSMSGYTTGGEISIPVLKYVSSYFNIQYTSLKVLQPSNYGFYFVSRYHPALQKSNQLNVSIGVKIHL
ncbi:MAG: hypothetical protein Q7U71_04135 [bacterium]|nr:hypothetical protein [bacterium]